MADIPYGLHYGELTPRNRNPEEQFDDEDFEKHILGNILAFLIFPAAIICNFTLVIIVVTRQKLRGDTWRILIAQTSACILLYAAIHYSGLFTEIFFLPSMQTSAICPAVVFFERVLDLMITFSIALVSIERFRSLKLNQDAGMTTRSIAITILVFWGLVLIKQTFAVATNFSLFYDKIIKTHGPGVYICLSMTSEFSLLTSLVFQVFALVSTLIVIIGIVYIICKFKPDHSLIVKAAVAPLVYGTINLALLSAELCTVYAHLQNWRLMENHRAAYTLRQLVYIAFPVMWLITWSLSGDLSWKLQDTSPCCQKSNPQESQLLQMSSKDKN